jgi:hypothetical protein
MCIIHANSGIIKAVRESMMYKHKIVLR